MPQLAVAAVFAYAGGAAATAAGFAAYAGVAASVAWGVGSLVGARMFGPDSAKATLADLRAPKLNMGQKMHRVYGTVRVALSPRWQSEWIPTENSSGGKGGGGGSEYYTYSAHVLYWISDIAGMPENLRVAGWSRIWWNGELAATRLDESDPESLVATDETEKWDAITFFDGAPDQLPWPIYEAALGAANADAHRRVACIGIENIKTGTWSNLPLLEAEVYTSGSGSLVLPGGLRDSTRGLGTTPTLPAYHSGDMLLLFTASLNVVGAPAGYTQAYAAGGGGAGFKLKVFARTADGSSDDSPNFTLTDSGSVGDFGAAWTMVSISQPLEGSLVIGGSSSGSSNPPDPPLHSRGGDAATYLVFAVSATNTNALTTPAILSAPPTGYESISDLTPPNWDSAWTGRHMVTYKVGSDITEANPDPFGISGSSYGAGQAISFTFMVRYEADASGVTPQTVDLADIVSAECIRCGLTTDDIDVTELVGIPVRGFLAQGSAREAIEDLMGIFHFYAVCSDKLYFRLLDAESVVTIPFADSGAGLDQPSEPFTGVERGNDLEVPSDFTVVSPNPSADYDPGAETSDRLVTAGRKKETVQSLVVLTPAERKGRANAFALDTRTAMHTARLMLDDTYAKLEPGDVITATDEDGNTYNKRITRESYADGVHEFETRLFNRSDLVTEGTTSDTYTPVINLAALADTELVLIDTGLLRDEDDGAHILAAVKPSGTGSWPGAAIYRSSDGSTFTQVASTATSAVIGESSDALGDFDLWVWDEENSVTVDVGEDATLTSSSRSAMQADKSINLAAIGADGRWEIIRYRTATLVSTGIYTLSGLLRGLQGTEANRSNHAVGDTFVKLDTASIIRIPVSVSDIGVDRYWKGVTVGQQVSTASSQTVSPDAVALECLAPSRLRVASVVAGNVTLEWMRRTRLAVRHGGTGGSVMPLGEASESYEIDIYEDDTFATVVRTLTSSTESVEYTLAQQTADFGSPPSEISVRVYQMSATVGRGYPVSETLLIGASGSTFVRNAADSHIDVRLSYVNSFLATCHGTTGALGFYEFTSGDLTMEFIGSVTGTATKPYLAKYELGAVNPSNGQWVMYLRPQGHDTALRKVVRGQFGVSGPSVVSTPFDITTNAPIGLTYADGQFIAITRDGSVYHSVDGGANWTDEGDVSGTGAPTGPADNLDFATMHIAEVAGVLVMAYQTLADGSDAIVSYNSARDGLVWTACTGDVATLPTATYDQVLRLYQSAEAGGVAVIVAIGKKVSSSDTYGLVYSSTDGIDWTLDEEQVIAAPVYFSIDGYTTSGVYPFDGDLYTNQWPPEPGSGSNSIVLVHAYGGADLTYPGRARAATPGTTVVASKGDNTIGFADSTVYTSPDFNTWTAVAWP